MSSIISPKTQLVTRIRKWLRNTDTYTFRPTKIDGINVYIVIYNKFKVVTVESIFIYCNVNVNNVNEIQNYSLYHFEYDTLEYAIDKIEEIINTYKLYNGELVDRTVYALSNLEECILPYSEDEKCCICLENTSDLTLCNHPVCLHCRETCLTKKMVDCPMCRKHNSLTFYNNTSCLINNEQFNVVTKAIHSGKNSWDIEVDYNRSHNEDVQWLISHTQREPYTSEDGEIIETATPTGYFHIEVPIAFLDMLNE